ncbi:MAG: pyrroloquinoline quinone-dependent dehydrogenase [Bacteroidota bacterium]
MNRKSYLLWTTIVALILITGIVVLLPKTDDNGWTTYAGNKAGIRYSANDQINKNNVKGLKRAWVYDTQDSLEKSQIQCNPIIINGVLYGTTPRMNLFAINAATGKGLWKFKPIHPNARGVIRGVSYWENSDGKNQRIIYSVGPYMYAVDAISGKSVQGFGNGGFIDLRDNLDGDYANTFAAGNAPGIVYKDLLITSMRVGEGGDAAPGHIRAFNALTGKRQWIFHTIPRPGEFGYDSWEDKNAWKHTGGTNNWAGMSLDEKRGVVYISTGSATPDFYGASRLGSNLFANCVIALNAETGKYIWHYQVVHHDLWDRDLPANPNLITVTHNGKQVDAVAQITKQGFIFLLDRDTGKPIFPVKEQAVPASEMPGEKAWPTQPIPTLPEPFMRQSFGPEDISDRTPEIHAQLLAQYNKIRSGRQYTPFSRQGNFIIPGFDGGGEWGGAAVDPESQILYVNASELPWYTAMIDNPALADTNTTHKAFTSLNDMGKSVYMKYCIACHGADRKGDGKAYPSLLNLQKKYNDLQVAQILENGRNMMPSFKSVPPTERAAITNFLLGQKDKEAAPVEKQKPHYTGTTPKYIMDGYHRFYDADGYPGIKPPWGTLNAVNLSTGKLLWKVPLGEFASLAKKGMPITGTEVYGGPVVTKGGLVFIASTQDAKIRAFDKQSGKELWQATLPACGFATPAIYTVNHKQYVVIACGGGKVGMPSGSKYVAFALP